MVTYQISEAERSGLMSTRGGVRLSGGNFWWYVRLGGG